MPALWIRAVVTLPHTSGLPEDAAQNVFHFDSPASAGDPADLFQPIEFFYNAALAGPTVVPIASMLSGALSRSTDACLTELYEVPLTNGPVGSPIASDTWTLGSLGSGEVPLPSEVACCLSLDATMSPLSTEPEIDPQPPTGPEGDIHPRARRRGRLYLGPLNSLASTGTSGGSSEPRPNATFISAATRSAKENLAVPLQADLWLWSVFSPTAWNMSTIHHVSVDNVFDTQRRRGPDPTGKTILAI